MGTLNNILAIKSSAADTGPVIQDSTGKEVGQACTAWVNFDGNTATIRNNFNVSGVVRNSVGDYTITFATPMANVNYTVNITGSPEVSVQHTVPFIHVAAAGGIRVYSTTQTRIGVVNAANSANRVDKFDVSCTVFGGN